MSTRVTCVIPSAGEVGLLEEQLPVLLAEAESRASDDRIVVVDAGGEAVLSTWVEERFPTVETLACEPAGSIALALLAGARSGDGDFLLALSASTAPEAGFLAPLVEALADPDVVAATPVVRDEDGRPRPSSALYLEDGRLRLGRLPADPLGVDPHPVPCPSAAAFLVRLPEFVERGGLDPLFAPMTWSEVDLGIDAWRAGGRVVAVPDSRVTVRGAPIEAPAEVVRAAEEKNRLLLLWKYLDTRRDAQDHLALLWRDALEAAIAGRREELTWMALALQEIPRVNRSREGLGPARRTLDQILRLSDPRG